MSDKYSYNNLVNIYVYIYVYVSLKTKPIDE